MPLVAYRCGYCKDHIDEDEAHPHQAHKCRKKELPMPNGTAAIHNIEGVETYVDGYGRPLGPRYAPERQVVLVDDPLEAPQPRGVRPNRAINPFDDAAVAAALRVGIPDYAAEDDGLLLPGREGVPHENRRLALRYVQYENNRGRPLELEGMYNRGRNLYIDPRSGEPFQ